MPRLIPLAATLLLALALAACGGDGDAAGGERQSKPNLTAVTTLPIFADFVREVGGDQVEVFALLPAGADPHTYEPLPSDVKRITETDVIFVNDIEPGVEGSILDVIQANKGDDTQVVAFLPRIQASDTEISDNPHLWLAPPFARAYAEIIEGTLAKRDPAGADTYSTNLARYADQLSLLDEEFAAAVERIAPERQKLITTHNAFLHLVQRYGLEIAGFIVPSPGQDPSPRDIADLNRIINEQTVPAVFTEPQIGAASRLLEQIAADTGVQVCTLYSGALDDDLPTYIEMMRFNADELLRCLGNADG